ncbi:MAG: flavodoxin domain-containing protein [Anaerolineaceae bacterium]|nr:flavodoxin domain-containing protein [Anaerolineaceae bacterium]
MNIVLLYDSYFLNTRKLAETIADVLVMQGASVHLERFYQFDFENLEGVDLLVLGTPTHNQGMPRPIKSVLKRLPGGTMSAVKMALFDTRYQMPARKSGSAAGRISRMLGKLGGEQLVSPQSFFVRERRGPLVEGELERARAWAVSLTR